MPRSLQHCLFMQNERSIMKIGFIGLGNMATAMMGGIINNKVAKAADINGSDAFEAARKKAADSLKIKIYDNNPDVVRNSDIIVLSVKPQFYPDVISDIKAVSDKKKIFITIAPGKTLEWLKGQFGKELKIVRCMPNTPALVGSGMTGVCPDKSVTETDMKTVMKILTSFGRAEVVPERMMDAVVSVSGSSPAYVFMMIEAMADQAVADGMPRPLAYEFAAQAVYGSAKMVLETGKHPAELKDMVCSPAGTTIDAVKVLEQEGFRAAIEDAMQACTEKSKSL